MQVDRSGCSRDHDVVSDIDGAKLDRSQTIHNKVIPTDDSYGTSWIARDHNTKGLRASNMRRTVVEHNYERHLLST